jgi:hypothetical protein
MTNHGHDIGFCFQVTVRSGCIGTEYPCLDRTSHPQAILSFIKNSKTLSKYNDHFIGLVSFGESIAVSEDFPAD